MITKEDSPLGKLALNILLVLAMAGWILAENLNPNSRADVPGVFCRPVAHLHRALLALSRLGWVHPVPASGTAKRHE